MRPSILCLETGQIFEPLSELPARPPWELTFDDGVSDETGTGRDSGSMSDRKRVSGVPTGRRTLRCLLLYLESRPPSVNGRKVSGKNNNFNKNGSRGYFPEYRPRGPSLLSPGSMYHKHPYRFVEPEGLDRSRRWTGPKPRD